MSVYFRFQEWEEERIRRYYGKVCDKALAERLQRQPHAIRDKAVRMGLRKPEHRWPWPEEDNKRLNELVAQGKTPREIGEIMGRSRNAILGRLWRQRRDRKG